jgi:hypothetical protein
MSNNTQVMRDLLDANKPLKDLNYIVNYTPSQVCTMIKNQNSKLIQHVQGKVSLMKPVTQLSSWCDRPAYHKKEISDGWKSLIQLIKGTELPEKAVTPINDIMNSIGILERNIGILKSRIVTWQAAGTRKRRSKQRRYTRSRS